ncbi:MAG: SsrA-binding protein, partial [Coriobacteriales bacterium]|nr:SsrA-binding protein [Coriobacteriales bacterium]
GRVKIELGLGRGNKLHDKRQTLAERDHKRDVERALRERQKGV